MDVSVRHFLLLTPLLALAVGCQSPDPSIELLESELRRMENQLYAMDRQLDRTCLQLSSARNSNRALQREIYQLRRQPGRPSPADRGDVDGSSTDDFTPPAVEVPRADEIDSEDLQVPQIDLGPDAPQSILPPDDTSTDEPDVDLDDLDNFTRDGDVDVRVTRIQLNSRLSGGYNFDGKPGDDGLLLVVEPQNAAGQYVPLPGDLEIEVLDPRASGPEARIARWEFDSSETVATMRKSLLGRGMHLQLPWPGERPSTENLRVNVHYKPSTGGRLTARRVIRIDLVAPPQAVELSDDSLGQGFVPRQVPRISQLLPDQAFTMPTAPLSGPAASSAGINQTPQTARRPTRRPSGRAPQWRPYR